MKLPTLTQSFNDGVVNIYSVENIAESGKLPKEGLKIKVSSLRYEERTVGMSRFYTAMQNQAKIEQILRVPRIDSVSTQDVAVPIDDKQYKIIQIQYPKDVDPPVMDLSLERLEANYAIS